MSFCWFPEYAEWIFFLPSQSKITKVSRWSWAKLHIHTGVWSTYNKVSLYKLWRKNFVLNIWIYLAHLLITQNEIESMMGGGTLSWNYGLYELKNRLFGVMLWPRGLPIVKVPPAWPENQLLKKLENLGTLERDDVYQILLKI